jgi:adenylate kinase family enzyme
LGAARRVAIVGNVAGGKSTLARALSEATGIPHREYDTLLWRGAELLSNKEAMAREQTWLAEDIWIIDGMGAWEAIERRLDRADGIIFVDLPLLQHCAWAAQRRLDQARRGEAPDPKEAVLDLETLFRVLEITHKRTRPRILAYLEAHPEKQIIRLRSKAALQSLVEDFRRKAVERRAKRPLPDTVTSA